jgi:excisionase family DNA binding protein
MVRRDGDCLIYRIRDLAALLGCTEVAARRMVERGAIPARRMGKRIIILRAELEEHLQCLPRHPFCAAPRAANGAPQ